MEIDLRKKYNYKLRNKKTGHFFSNSRKATWQRAHAIIDILINKHNYTPSFKNKIDEWEIVLIPLENPLVISATDFLDFYKEEEEVKEENRKQKKIDQENRIKEIQKQREIDILKSLQRKYPDVH